MNPPTQARQWRARSREHRRNAYRALLSWRKPTPIISLAGEPIKAGSNRSRGFESTGAPKSPLLTVGARDPQDLLPALGWLEAGPSDQLQRRLTARRHSSARPGAGR